jgi:hypothetical protein
MKSHHLVMGGVAMVAIVAITLITAWAKDTSRAERALVTEVGPMLDGPVNLNRSFRVNCASATATNVLVPMDGGSSAYPVPASSIYVAPCEFDNDGGPATCTTQRDVRVGSSAVTINTGFDVGAGGRDGPGISMDAKGAWCAGVGGAQQVDVVVGVK